MHCSGPPVLQAGSRAAHRESRLPQNFAINKTSWERYTRGWRLRATSSTSKSAKLAGKENGMTEKQIVLQQPQVQDPKWQQWGPYLSERQWGTVREDYSENGDAWAYFSHDQARSRAYRWGEDGLGGISDDHQLLCFALALWNDKDPILKERLFGLTNSEGNHGEDVKEYYFYLDSTPTHSYMKYL